MIVDSITNSARMALQETMESVVFVGDFDDGVDAQAMAQERGGGEWCGMGLFGVLMIGRVCFITPKKNG